jgi:hypothetical protein
MKDYIFRNKIEKHYLLLSIIKEYKQNDCLFNHKSFELRYADSDNIYFISCFECIMI